MLQRNALIGASALTAFVLTVIGGVAAGTALGAPASAAPPPAGASVSDPAANLAMSGYPVAPDIAAAIALNAAPGATLTGEPELINYQGTAAYEVKLDRGLVYVNATSGQVLFNGANQPAARPAGEHEDDEHEDDEHEGGEHEGDD